MGHVRSALLWSALVALNVWFCSTLLLQRGNTLHENGRWRSTKVELERGVVGGVSFVVTRRALLRNRLDLGTWHGYQEVLYRAPLALDELTLRFRLTRGGYLVVLLDHTADSFAGLRLSADPVHPSACLAGTAEGRFTRRAALEIPPLGDLWHRVTVRSGADAHHVSLDGRDVGACSEIPVRPTHLGLRGGARRGTLVDDVALRTADGEWIREDFRNRSGLPRAVLLSLLAVLALAVAALVLGRRRAATDAWIPALATLLTLAVILGMILVADTVWLWTRYPEHVDHPGYRNSIESEKHALRRLAGAYPPGPPAPGVRRILFLGSSQTWGAGAARGADAWIARLERRWNAAAAPGVRYELINAGISGLEALRTRELYEAHWLAWEPEAVVVVLGHNDEDPDQLGRELGALARTNRARGIRTVFVPEPESGEKLPGRSPPGRCHAAIRAAARRHDVPLVEVHDALLARAVEGFIWWDRVHLTSFGQELMAEEADRQRAVILAP